MRNFMVVFGCLVALSACTSTSSDGGGTAVPGEGVDAAEVGPIGPAGPAGPEGPMGPAGPTGPRGQDGVRGYKGEDGAKGAQGATGAKGEQGEMGPMGPMGPAGVNGTNGVDGAPGAKGATGATGPAGPAGTITRGKIYEVREQYGFGSTGSNRQLVVEAECLDSNDVLLGGGCDNYQDGSNHMIGGYPITEESGPARYFCNFIVYPVTATVKWVDAVALCMTVD